MQSGTSLLEVTVVLTLLAVALSVGFQTVAPILHRIQIVGASDEVIALVHLARSEALRVGEAELAIDVRTGVVTVRVVDRTVRTAYLSADYGVELWTSSRQVPVELRFGPLGLGIFAGQTVTLTAGSTRGRVVISPYGRARRR